MKRERDMKDRQANSPHLLPLLSKKFFGQAAGGIRDFSPWIRDPTCAPAVEVQSLNYWTDKEVPQHLLPFQEVFWMLSCNVSAYISFAISSFKEG